MAELISSKKNGKSLSPGLTSRQVTMISIAGIIGAGLFIGSSKAIAAAGPAILISYTFTGLLVLVVMRMLGEMAVSQPDTGSFSTYADRAIGRWAGFTIGWLYWWYWVLVIPVEAIAGANILNSWLPAVPEWIFSFGIVFLLTITNLFSVKNFGAFEFWFSIVKVVAIIAFIILGVWAVTGKLPTANANVGGIDKLWSVGGFMPHGFGAVIGGVLVTVFSFFGAEIVSIAASESENPEVQITRATKLVVYRIALFYIVSIFLVVALVPWNDPRLVEVGSFQRALEIMNIPWAKPVVDVVVLVAVCSCMNSALYTSSRMLFSLGKRGDAPASTCTISQAGVPRVAVIGSTLAGFAGCLANYFFPGQVFSLLLSSTGAFGLVLYLVIAFTQLRMRHQMNMRGETPKLKMWLYPWLTWFTILVIAAILGYMFYDPDYRFEAFMTLIVTVFVLVASAMVGNKRKVTLQKTANNKANLTSY